MKRNGKEKTNEMNTRNLEGKTSTSVFKGPPQDQTWAQEYRCLKERDAEEYHVMQGVHVSFTVRVMGKNFEGQSEDGGSWWWIKCAENTHKSAGEMSKCSQWKQCTNRQAKWASVHNENNAHDESLCQGLRRIRQNKHTPMTPDNNIRNHSTWFFEHNLR